MLTGPPFYFGVRESGGWIDPSNSLKLALNGWPEYNFSVSVEPLRGRQAGAWPIRKRAYFEFGLIRDKDNGHTIVRISRASAYEPFERDYPGRSKELLDVALPLACPLYVQETGWAAECAPIPARLRDCLARSGAYYFHRDG